MSDKSVYAIYLLNYQFFNKGIQRKNKYYYNQFDEKRMIFWLCDGELMLNKVKKIKIDEHSHYTGSYPFDYLNFEFDDGYLISNKFKNLGCKNYKFKCETW